METFHCPYLGGPVELNNERGRHIAEKHPQLLPNQPDYIVAAPTDPDLLTRTHFELKG